MTIMKKLVVAAIAIMGLTQAHAQTALPSLRIPPDARAAGMGNLGLATAADASSMYYNFAKTPFASSRTAIGVNYNPWMRGISSDMYLLAAGGYHQLDEQQAIGVNVRYFNMGDLSVTDYSGQKINAAHPQETAVDLGYARKLSGKLSLAIAMRYINSRLAIGDMDGQTYRAGNALAGDVSLFYNGVDSANGGWSAGAALTNLGSKINYTDDANTKESLPTDLGVGIAYTKVLDEDNRVMAGVDYHRLLMPDAPSGGTIGIGAEYTYRNRLSLRAGYQVVPEEIGSYGGLTAGAGVSFYGCTAQLSYLAAKSTGAGVNPFRNTLKFGFQFLLQ